MPVAAVEARQYRPAPARDGIGGITGGGSTLTGPLVREVIRVPRNDAIQKPATRAWWEIAKTEQATLLRRLLRARQGHRPARDG
jgi:hypothetical protein